MNIENMNVDDLIEDINYRVDLWVHNNLRQISPDDIGLDNRSAYKLHIGESCIAIPTSNRSSLDYYGGFEYIDKDYVRVLGDWTFYMSGDNRVDECLNRVPDEDDDE